MITKIQYNNFETGEFTDEKERSLEETIRIINDFPWQQQREHYVISLTGPSITIQGANDHFLKLAPYYNGKFVLYLCKRPKTLFSKSFDSLSDAFPFIQSFVNDPTGFDTAALKKQTTWFQDPTPHFRTGNFTYDLNGARLFSASAPLLVAIVYTLIFTIFGLFGKPTTRPILIIPLVMCCILLGVARLFVNHLKASRGQVLILSKGQDEFAYGPAANPIWRNKKDIVELITHGQRGRGGSYYAMTRVEIIFLNGEDPLNVSCLLLNWNDLMKKFSGYPASATSELFPFMPPDALAPS